MTQQDAVVGFGRAGDIDRQHLARQFKETVTGLSENGAVIRIDTAEDHTEQSEFYRDGPTRVYTVSPYEHPVIVTVIDEFLTAAADMHGIDARRQDDEQYTITVVEECQACHGETGVLHNTSSDVTGGVTVGIPCPFAEIDSVSCCEAVTAADSYMVTSNGNCVSTPADDRLTAIAADPLPELGEQSPGPVTACQTLVVVQDTVTPLIAKFVGLLDVIAFIRAHPVASDTARDMYRVSGEDPPADVVLETFEHGCEDFTSETTTGWRLRWVLLVLGDDTAPIENIAGAAQIPVDEARLTLMVLELAGIVTSSETCGEVFYELTSEYQQWREAHDTATFVEAESSFVAETTNPVQVIRQSYTTLTSHA